MKNLKSMFLFIVILFLIPAFGFADSYRQRNPQLKWDRVYQADFHHYSTYYHIQVNSFLCVWKATDDLGEHVVCEMDLTYIGGRIEHQIDNTTTAEIDVDFATDFYNYINGPFWDDEIYYNFFVFVNSSGVYYANLEDDVLILFFDFSKIDKTKFAEAVNGMYEIAVQNQ